MRAATVLALALTGCGFYPWTPHATETPKPDGPLTAPNGRGLVVIVQNLPQGTGNGAPFVFSESGDAIAQFPVETAGWMTAELWPGPHELFVRTFSNSFCGKFEVNVKPGKVYVLVLKNEAGGGFVVAQGTDAKPFLWLSPRNGDDPGGRLAFHPRLALEPAAEQELRDHASDLEECMQKARESFNQADPFFALRSARASDGFDEVVFARTNRMSEAEADEAD